MERSHIWLARFPTEARLDAFFAEQFEDDDLPVNGFAASQGEESYDHDWVEHSFTSELGLREMISPHSYSTDYIDDVINRAEIQTIANANTFIMADSNEITSPRSVNESDYEIWYIGEYECSI